MSGLIFTGVFLTIFMLSEHYHEKRRRGARHQHLEQFNKELAEEVTPEALGLTKPYRKLVAIRSPQNLFMLEKALAETDPDNTDVIVMTAKVRPPGPEEVTSSQLDLDPYDQQLMTAVVDRAERAGKKVKPVILSTNNPLHAVLKTAKDLQVQELIVGASNKFTADEQLEQIAFYWIDLNGGQQAPLTVRLLSRNRDVSFDLGGGNRIPKISERKARSVAELRAAGVGVDRVLLIHDDTPAASDLYQTVLTVLDPHVMLDLLAVTPETERIHKDRDRANHLGREVEVHPATGAWEKEAVRLAATQRYGLIILRVPAAPNMYWAAARDYLLQHASGQVVLWFQPGIPQEVVDV